MNNTLHPIGTKLTLKADADFFVEARRARFAAVGFRGTVMEVDPGCAALPYLVMPEEGTLGNAEWFGAHEIASVRVRKSVILHCDRTLCIRRGAKRTEYDLRHVTDASQKRLAIVLNAETTRKQVELDDRDLTPTVYFWF